MVRSYCGHGIHRLFHTAPSVPHYARNKAVGVMQAGHCFTIEPMINSGGWRDDQWPDKWTAVTSDGSWSAQVIILPLVVFGSGTYRKVERCALPALLQQPPSNAGPFSYCIVSVVISPVWGGPLNVFPLE